MESGVDDKKIFLSNEEVLQMNLNNEKISSIMKDMRITELEMSQLEVYKQLLETRKEKHNSNLVTERINARSYLNMIHGKYDIPEGQKWGFNSENNELVLINDDK